MSTGPLSPGLESTPPDAVVLEPSEVVTFEDFYRSEYEWARCLGFALTGDTAQADDLAQESFARLYKHFARVDVPKAYLRVTLINLHRRHRRRARRIRIAESSESDGPSAPSLELLDLIDRLPARQRAVLVLRYLEGMSEAEIAAVLSCRPGTVKSLSSRALSRLRKDLEE